MMKDKRKIGGLEFRVSYLNHWNLKRPVPREGIKVAHYLQNYFKA